MSHEPDIAVIGAGAAGLFAAIHANHVDTGRAPSRVVAFDGAIRIGAKILVAGGGRCNVTHHAVSADDFNPAENRNAIARILRTFTVADTIAWFAAHGVELKREDTGKLFPVSDDAQTVLTALLQALDQAGVELRTAHRVIGIVKRDDGFAIHTNQGEFTARKVILATGGKSLPKTGSDGAGYDFARSLGHTVTPTLSALAPLVLPPGHWLTALTGLSFEAELTLTSATGKVLQRCRGSLLLTHFGLSGPVVLDMSRHWVVAHTESPDAKLTANLTLGMDKPAGSQPGPPLGFDAADQRWQSLARAFPTRTLGVALRQWLPHRLADALSQQVLADRAELPMSQMSREDRRRLVHALTALPLPVVRDRGFLFAEVTAGGVPMREINPSTMASRRCEGLYLCGEILDVDGRIGGFNFQWAWTTGRLAGISAAQDIPGR